MVPTALIWRTDIEQYMILDDVVDSPDGISTYTDLTGVTFDRFTSTASHEFGHVLGLFDAYGYKEHFLTGDFWLPAAPVSSEVPVEDIMRSPWWNSPQYMPIDYEMMLYAWSSNSLQLYVDSVLGGTSQAFFH
jgi:hypothetical protein